MHDVVVNTLPLDYMGLSKREEWALLHTAETHVRAGSWSHMRYSSLHTLQVRLDYADLSERLDWALTHDSAAHEIAQQAAVIARLHLRIEDVECHWRAPLLPTTPPKPTPGPHHVAWKRTQPRPLRALALFCGAQYRRSCTGGSISLVVYASKGAAPSHATLCA